VSSGGAAHTNEISLIKLLEHQDLKVKEMNSGNANAGASTNLQFTICCAMATLFSAFLVFQIQPVVSKMILPWFGGGPAVWTSCMMFFQIMLLAGYAYAYSVNRWLSLRLQVICHMTLISVCLLFLPIIPGDAWKPKDGSLPTFRILAVLSANVGLPYFLLSATAPLLQAWYAARMPGKIPYRLYALSNVGSLFALLSFPFLIEPLMGSAMQAYLWAAGFVVFALCCAGMAFVLVRDRDSSLSEQLDEATAGDSDEVVEQVTKKKWISWLLLSGLGAFSLLSISNHICLEMTASPLMWVLPLSVYLLTFILNFEYPRLYVPRLWAVGCMAAIVGFAFLNHDRLVLMDQWFESPIADYDWSDYYGDHLVLLTTMALLALFFVCMMCHGELVRQKPPSRYLTSFYMALATGGAIGGMSVALLCPLLFDSFIETKVMLALGLLLACYVPVSVVFANGGFSSSRGKSRCVVTCVNSLVIGAVGLWLVQTGNWNAKNDETVLQTRNFYGVLRIDVEEAGDDGQLGRALYYGQTLHGFQFISSELSKKPTTYYSADSGLALALAALGENDKPLRVGIVGLGSGTTAVYGRKGDYFHFYEINPDVVRLARSPFTFLADCSAEVEITLADARMALERQPDQNYDLLALDAFSGDAIPAHLLTMEAVETYRKHLKKGGVLAVHISNRYLNLYPVVAGIAAAQGWGLVCVDTEHDDDAGQDEAGSSWCLLSTDVNLLERPEIQEAKADEYYNDRPAIQWTDQYSNLFHVLD